MTAFVFDLDDTLYSLKTTFKKALDAFLPGNTYDIPAFYTIYREEGLKLYEASQNGELTMDEYHIYRTIQAFERVGIVLNDDQALTFHDFYAHYKKEIELDPETQYLLNILKQKDLNLGIITNGNPTKQTKTMESLGIASYFDPSAILISGNTLFEKPNPNIFSTWEKQTNTKGQIVYIGDHFENDIVGANAAGWIPVWFNPDNKIAPVVDFEYYEVQKLPEILVLPLFNDQPNPQFH